jgi:hypothetical protein
MKDIIVQILQSNPGIVNLIISGLLLPAVILLLNNRQSRKIKELESQIDLNKIRATKAMEGETALEEKRRAHEDVVLSSLYKILFEAQRLHIELSTHCVDYQCIDRALVKFQTGFEKYQGLISDNQMFLSSKTTGQIYKFYQSLAELLIELQDLKAANKSELACVSVFEHSQKLSEQVIDVQETFVQTRPAITKDFKKKDLKPVSGCCGRPPSVLDKEALKAALDELVKKKSAQSKKPDSPPS